jgi:tetratricopeptide (TPR) repeat protein
MRDFLIYLLSLFLSALSGCASNLSADGRTPFDELPMYGGQDRRASATLSAADDALIAGLSKELGSRERASIALVNRGFALYRQDDLAGAMRRFNQAWLLNPNFPETYWGFASVLNDQRKFCDAVAMNEIAMSKGNIQEGFLPDAAVTYASCAATDPSLGPVRVREYLQKSDEIFKRAYSSETAKKDYVLKQWASALLRRGEYQMAWSKVTDYRRLTGKDLPEKFLQTLRAKMAEPPNAW